MVNATVPIGESRFVDVRGIRTHYFEAGEGSTVVLLHSGEFGGSAQLSWETIMPALAERHHVIAPDWLGYGETDKVYDFARGGARRIEHMTEFLQELNIEGATFIGNSMGATVLSRIAAQDEPVWPIDALVLISGGGFVPDNEARRIVLEYDCTIEAMQRLVGVMFYDDKWAQDEAYVRRRFDSSLVPGAWECAAAARLKPPHLPSRTDFGQADTTPYESIAAPTLVIAGAEDVLRLPGYADELGARIPDARVNVYERCGHVAHLEWPERVIPDLLEFLSSVGGLVEAGKR